MDVSKYLFGGNTFFNLKQYGEIEDCQIDDSSLHAVITFKTRAEAEAVSIAK